MIRTAKTALTASLLALPAFALAPAASAQVVSGGTSDSVSGDNVSVGTCGNGNTTGSSIDVSGCADAAATQGGIVNTRTKAKVNAHHGMQHSMARARDDDEHAHSMTLTNVRPGKGVRSRTITIYKQKGEKPVHRVVTTNSTPDGTKSKRKPH